MYTTIIEIATENISNSLLRKALSIISFYYKSSNTEHDFVFLVFAWRHFLPLESFAHAFTAFLVSEEHVLGLHFSLDPFNKRYWHTSAIINA